MKKSIIGLLAVLGLSASVYASEGGIAWDKAPDKTNDMAALQNGAKIFVNNCLNCHSAAYMRFNRLKDIGLSEQQIKDNLLFTTDKVGDAMKVAMDPKNAKDWFGGVPPDSHLWHGLAQISARARAQIICTLTCVPTIAMTQKPVVGTTWLIPMSACLMFYGKCRASANPFTRKLSNMGKRQWFSKVGNRSGLAPCHLFNLTSQWVTWSGICSGCPNLHKTTVYKLACGCSCSFCC